MNTCGFGLSRSYSSTSIVGIDWNSCGYKSHVLIDEYGDLCAEFAIACNLNDMDHTPLYDHRRCSSLHYVVSFDVMRSIELSKLNVVRPLYDWNDLELVVHNCRIACFDLSRLYRGLVIG